MSLADRIQEALSAPGARAAYNRGELAEFIAAHLAPCDECNGSGKIAQYVGDWDAWGGERRVADTTCWKCDGTGASSP